VRASRRRLERALRRVALAAAAASTTACQGAGSEASDGGSDAGKCSSVLIEAGALVTPEDGGCIALRFLPCGLPGGATVDKCNVDVATCASICTPPFLYCALATGSCTAAGGAVADAAALVSCVACVSAGSRTGRGEGPVP